MIRPLGGAAQRDRQGEDRRAGRSRARDEERRGRARRDAHRAASGAGRARRARRLAARSAPRVRHLRGRPLQHARACGGKAGRVRAARRAGDVQPVLRPCGRGPRQDASAAVDRLGRQRHPRAQGALPDRREVHVRLRGGAESADRDRLQGSAARHRRAGDRRPAVPAGQVDAGRVLPHAQRADRCRPSGGDRGRPSAVRSRKPRRPRALAPRRRARGRDGIARGGAAAGDPARAASPPRARITPASTCPRRCSASSPSR